MTQFFSGGNPMIRSNGILTSRPRNKRLGEYPVDLCGEARYAAKTVGSLSSQSRCESATTFPSIEFKVRWKRSTSPFVLGWYGDVFSLSISIHFNNCTNNSL